jgi:hypothetical protein
VNGDAAAEERGARRHLAKSPAAPDPPCGMLCPPYKKKKKKEKKKTLVRWGTALSLLHTVVISFIGRSDLSIFTAILNSGTKEEQLRLYESRCL